MQAIILAAGEGKRLRPLTKHIPKPMVAVGGQPILEYTLSILPKQIDEVVLVVGYRGEQIQNYFGDSFGRVRLRYAKQKTPKGTGDALRTARTLIHGNTFLVLQADDLYHPDDLENCLQNTPTVLVKESEQPERFGVCILGENNRLRDIIEKPALPPSNLVNIGVYFLNKKIFGVPEVFLLNGESNLVAQIGILARREPIQVIKARFWHPIGYLEDIETADHFMRLPVEGRLN